MNNMDNMDKEINRRQFISGVGAGILSLSLSGCKLPNSSSTTSKTKASITPKVTPTPIDSRKLIVAEGTEPELLLENGLKALGGIGQFVKEGDCVVLKPNFSVTRKPEEAATTNPQLVAALVKQCFDAGAKEVKVIDFPFMSMISLTTSGIKDAVEKAGGQAYTIEKKDNFEEVDMGGTVLKKVLYSKDVIKADVFISMPILKHHEITQVTMGLKNMMGLVYDRQYFHSSDLNIAIAELNAYRKPDLIIMDAIKGIVDNGPVGPGTIKEWDQVVFGVDPVAVDAYGAKLFGVTPEDITHLSRAAKLGVGEIDLQKITIQKV